MVLGRVQEDLGTEAEKHKEPGRFGGTVGQVGRGEDAGVQSEGGRRGATPLLSTGLLGRGKPWQQGLELHRNYFKNCSKFWGLRAGDSGW